MITQTELDNRFFILASTLKLHYERKVPLHSRLADILIPSEFITKGRSKNGSGYKEHVVPLSHLNKEVYKLFDENKSLDDVIAFLKRNLIVIKISKDEASLLDSKHKTTMPEGWQDDPYIRLSPIKNNIIFD